MYYKYIVWNKKYRKSNFLLVYQSWTWILNLGMSDNKHKERKSGPESRPQKHCYCILHSVVYNPQLLAASHMKYI